MKKQKDAKQMKKDALMSFLQTTATQSSKSEIDIQKQPSQQQQAYEQYVEELTICNVCGKQPEEGKVKKCEFCSTPACNDHMRKRRKKKGKWQKICDSCQDRYLFDAHMKLQMKAQQSITVEEEITYLKHDNFAKQAEEKRQKRRQVGFKTMTLQKKYESQIVKIEAAQNRLMSFQHQVESLQLSVKQTEVFVQRASSTFKQNNQESFNILSEENMRMGKQLAKLQKKALEIKSAIQKKEKEIQSSFQVWAQRQFKKKIQMQEKAAAAKKKECQIY